MKKKYLNCTIVHSKNNKNIGQIKKAIKTAERENKKFYNIKIQSYTLILLDSLKEYKKRTHYKKSVSNACVKYKKIFLFVPSKSEEKKYHPLNFILYHELNHLLYIHGVSHIKPQWLSEGITFLNQISYKPQIGWKKYLSYLKNPEKYLLVNASHLQGIEERNKFYITSFFCIKYLEKKFKIKKITNFLKEIPNPYNNRKFWEVFEKKFKLSKKQLITNSLKLE